MLTHPFHLCDLLPPGVELPPDGGGLLVRRVKLHQDWVSPDQQGSIFRTKEPKVYLDLFSWQLNFISNSFKISLCLSFSTVICLFTYLVAGQFLYVSLIYLCFCVFPSYWDGHWGHWLSLGITKFLLACLSVLWFPCWLNHYYLQQQKRKKYSTLFGLTISWPDLHRIVQKLVLEFLDIEDLLEEVVKLLFAHHFVAKHGGG